MATATSVADLLGAASLLLTALAVLYGVWYASIDAARARFIPLRAGDAEEPLAEVRGVLIHRAYPLALASALTTLVFASEAIGITRDTVEAFNAHQLHAFDYYDPIEAAFVLVVIGSGLLTWHVGKLSLDLRQTLRDGALLPE